MTGIEKWSTIHRTMSDQKIAILAIQETHLDDELESQVVQCYGKRILLITSHNPTLPRASAGIAFVINKRLIKPSDITVFELMAGRALALKIKWHDTEVTTLLNVYAPNSRAAQPQFWRKIEAAKKLYKLRNPDIILGDFNLTEDAIDRSPPHLDDAEAITALREIRHKWRLHDEWRHSHPSQKVFTYRANTNTHPIKSRLNRIYTTSRVAQRSFNWQHNATPVPTDHWLTSVKFAPFDAPHIGNGRWTWSITTLQNKKLIQAVVDEGMKLQAAIENTAWEQTERNTSNPQLLWNKYKEDIKSTAKSHNKETYRGITVRVTRLKKDIKDITQHPDFDTDEIKWATEAILAQELEYLEKRQARDKKDKLRVEIALHGEKLGGVWSALSKENKPRDIVYRLRIPNSNPPQYERSSKRMAQLARDYHNALQHSDLPTHPDPEEDDRRLESILNEIPNNQKLEIPDESALN
jgi:exonuclease III